MSQMFLKLVLFSLLLVTAPSGFCGDTKTSSKSNAVSALADFPAEAKKIPFKDVIAFTTYHRVLDFDTNNAAHLELHKKLLQAAAAAGARAAKEGIFATRPNEAGNGLESFVRNALRDAGLDARIPVNSEGEHQVTGYPDVEIAGPVPCYLELKTYNAATANTTQRSFYFSPSAHPKVTHDALHFLLAYQLEKQSRDNKTVFVPVHWKLLTLENLVVDLKLEFNQSNRGLYGPGAGKSLLSEGSVD
jgi:hypothetical protein